MALAAQASAQETMLRTGRPVQADWPARLRHEFTQPTLALDRHRAVQDQEKTPHA